jgi:hypothetical protein
MVTYVALSILLDKLKFAALCGERNRRDPEMTSLTRHVAVTGAALATAGALIAAMPTINAGDDITLASAPAATTMSTAINLMSYSEWQGKSEGHGHGGGGSQAQGAGSYDDDDEDEGEGDDDHHGWGGGGGGGNIGSFITNFLDNNQAQVLSVTAGIPVFNLGPVAVGNSLLANAYYTGFDPGTGVVTGVPGVVAYVTSQFGGPQSDLVKNIVLSVTSMTPQINLGPVAVGNGLLANAYFSGYNGSATGIPGLVSYVTSQLGIQAPAPAGAVKAAAVVGSKSVVAARTAAVAAPAAADSSAAGTAKADSSAAGTAKADSASAGRSALGRATAKAASSAGHVRSAAARAAAK